MFKCEILHGFSLAPQEEIDSIVRGASEEFQGTSYNLLTKNCKYATLGASLHLLPPLLLKVASTRVLFPVGSLILSPGYNTDPRHASHFTAHLVERLTGRSSPGWLNRAASIGMALPCVVPKEWIEPPDHESGHELALDDDDEPSESSSMLGEQHAAHMHLLGVDEDESAWQDQDQRRHGEGGGNGSKRRAGQIRDDAGRVLPAAEVAPAARRP